NHLPHGEPTVQGHALKKKKKPTRVTKAFPVVIEFAGQGSKLQGLMSWIEGYKSTLKSLSDWLIEEQ
ncbi:hypothetical protein FRX31_006270, partial [Thalictrum thalictroides]